MGLIDKINSDLKQALLSGDRSKTETLKSIKNALQYLQTSAGAKDELGEDDVLAVLKKESKKRREAAEAYDKAGDSDRSNAEKQEKAIIDAYLPEQMSEAQVEELVDAAIAENAVEKIPKNMGQIIKLVRDKAGAQADGAVIAKIVKTRVSG
jgi:hypothetical protein